MRKLYFADWFFGDMWCEVSSQKRSKQNRQRPTDMRHCSKFKCKCEWGDNLDLFVLIL